MTDEQFYWTDRESLAHVFPDAAEAQRAKHDNDEWYVNPAPGGWPRAVVVRPLPDGEYEYLARWTKVHHDAPEHREVWLRATSTYEGEWFATERTTVDFTRYVPGSRLDDARRAADRLARATERVLRDDLTGADIAELREALRLYRETVR